MKKKKIILTVTAAAVLIAALALFGLMQYGKAQMKKIPGLSFAEALEYTTADAPDAVITVGIIKDGQASYTVYGQNGKVLPSEPHTYEIGSLTKTFTAALISRAVREERLSLDAAIDSYLPLPAGKRYPTVKELLTHTSGYKGYYFETPMIANFFKGRNDYYGITRGMVLARAGKIDLKKGEYGFDYSNFGYAVLGLVLESVYGTDYTALLNDFVQSELGLADTRISEQNGDLRNYWNWKADDAYLSAGAVTSDIEDMLRYAQMLLEDDPHFADCTEWLETIDASTEDYKMMGINMDGIGMAWVIDSENGIIWHNGGTGHYNSYLGIAPAQNKAVVILSNLPPGHRIPATVLGIKLLTSPAE